MKNVKTEERGDLLYVATDQGRAKRNPQQSLTKCFGASLDTSLSQHTV